MAYADLARISDEKFVRQQFEAETSADANSSCSQLVALSEADLAARHVTLAADEKVFAGTIDLFDRVRLTAAIDGLPEPERRVGGCDNLDRSAL